MIDLIGASKYFTDEQKLPWIAEAKVLRALYYYYLTSTFGDVPFYTEAVTEQVSEAYLKQFPELEGKYSVHICHSADGVGIR